ncbi:hypothetical protein V6R21_15535 [Limibacter armeniacum]|uniref:hypothetical protein n=1 Tax=Limibacter armeniacum TaxID=466084 RepID=UPI002FE626A6
MNPQFDEIYTSPENQVFHVVFYPDRIYHARYLNATRSKRYRYNVTEVRGKADFIVMKGQVYLDGKFYSNFIRIEYKASRLLEKARESKRFLAQSVMAWVKLHHKDGQQAEATIKLHYCEWVKSYQVEIWDNLEPPFNNPHDIKVLDLVGYQGEITKVKPFTNLIKEVSDVGKVEIAFRENNINFPMGWAITDMDAQWDNNFGRGIQVPNTLDPSNQQNTVEMKNYMVDFQRAYFLEAENVQPVRYRNAMMNDDNPERFDNNIIEMKWMLQRELGGNLVFFHEVTIPPHTVEGTHRHIGSEELYYIVEGEGVAYIGEGDDPKVDAAYETVNTSIYGLENRNCKEVPVKPGAVIYTKSGGIHGIRNLSDKPLKFVAFLYHSA